MQRTLLALALIATASVSYAQTAAPSGEPVDPYGRPLIGYSVARIGIESCCFSFT